MKNVIEFERFTMVRNPSAVRLARRDPVRRISDAIADNAIPEVPGLDETKTAIRVARKPLVRRIAARSARIGAGALAGYHAGRKYGGAGGAVVGALAATLLDCPEVRKNIELSVARSKQIHL